MTHDCNPITDRQIDIFLDGLLDPAERKMFEERLRICPEAAEEAERLSQIDASLRRLFPPQQVPEEQLRNTLATSGLATSGLATSGLATSGLATSGLATSGLATSGLATSDGAKQSSLRQEPTRSSIGLSIGRAKRVALIGLAAGIAWILVVWQLARDPAETPFFQPRPVALVYQEVVDGGFEPYYECREADRFSATFQRRQSQALSLAALPSGSRMLGLSYAGGLSRDTTAMLCQVDGQPVMVFVDRLENDQPIATQLDASKLQVHRVARDGLVFYEVTPFATSRVIEYLVPAEVDKNS